MDMEMPPTGAVPGFISASSLCDIATCIEFVYDFISASSVWDHSTVCSSLAAARRRNSVVTAGMSGESAASPAATQIGDFLAKKPYAPPSWASHLSLAPSHTFSLGVFPTPIHKWNLPNLPEGTEVWIKRDDLSGMQLSGNKVRKLEFLLSEAVAQGADCVITVGGIQSSHCRATAVAAKYLNLDCYLILSTSKHLVDKDPGLDGNLLVARVLGAHIDLVSEEEYGKIGSVALADLLKKRLMEEGRKPYVIPVGGSNSLGTWGYVQAVREIEQQIQLSGDVQLDDIVVACGSGGTIAGIALGSKLSSLKAKVHAFSVCDDPEYAYDCLQGLIDGLQSGLDSRDIVTIEDWEGSIWTAERHV
nr:putative D-cysteine desulfhydrase 1, mitochondrial isoform X2 [Lolium perenne]